MDAMTKLAPVAPGQRIEAMDIVRGFALLGIFLMNVEFFSRPLQDIGSEGINSTLLRARLRRRCPGLFLRAEQVLDPVLDAVRHGLRGDD